MIKLTYSNIFEYYLFIYLFIRFKLDIYLFVISQIYIFLCIFEQGLAIGCYYSAIASTRVDL